MLTGALRCRPFRSPTRAEVAQRADELFIGRLRWRIRLRRGRRLRGPRDRGYGAGGAHAVAGAEVCVFKNARMRAVTSGTTSGSRRPSMDSTLGHRPATSPDTP